MKVAILGQPGSLARETRRQLESRQHEIVTDAADCALYFPGSEGDLQEIVSSGRYSRLVLRSHAYAYGSNPKNPGMMEEGRMSLLPADAPERRWLALESAALNHVRTAAVRLTNVLDTGENDLLVQHLANRGGLVLAGRDPAVQFISLADAASALVAAAESSATGVFNAAGDGAIPLKKALRAADARRIPMVKLLAPLLKKGASLDQFQDNWTVSSERAKSELNWRPRQSTTAALQEFLDKRGGAGGPLLESYDDWGLDVDYIRAWRAWFWFLRNVYWRIDHEGLEQIPSTGRAMLVSNHRGFVPIDAVMHLSLIFTHRERIPRFLIIHSLLRLPFLCNFLTKLGGVVASEENVAKLFAAENLVGIFPEGIRGTFKPYKTTYQLNDFSKSSFAKLAIEHQAPVIPAAVVGHAEIFPIIGRIDSSLVTREFGWPYLPIAPLFPLAPIPIPVKWHVRVLPPVPFQGLQPADAEHPKIVREFSKHIQNLLQANINDIRTRRKHFFWGKVLDGSRPEPPSILGCRSQTAGGTR
jgi:1-acyl-sn-glycerol-3-phosphate acyltransferase